MTNNMVSLYLKPVSEGLGVSRTSVSFTSSVRSVGTFLSNLSFGLVYRKFGFRKLAAAGILLIGLAFCGMASSQTVLAYGIFCFLVGISEAAISTAAISKAVSEWFVKSRGTVLGIITAASGLGGSLFAIILSSIMEEKGWRASQYFGGFLVILAAVLLFVVVRSKPSDIGTVAFGEGEAVEAKKKRGARFEGFTMEQLRKSPVFFLLLLSAFVSALCVYAPYHILFTHLMDKGIPQADAAKIQSLMFILLAATKVLDGTLSDVLGAKKVVVFSTLCTGTACLLLTGVSTLGGAILPTVLVAIGLPITTLLPALSTAELLGSRSYDTMIGLVLATVAVANMVSNPIMNSVYDKFGSYDIALRCAAALTVVSAALYIVLCLVTKRELKKCGEE